MALTLIINGQARCLDGVSSGDSLADVIAAMALRPDRVAVEWKGSIVRREQWGTTAVVDGDKLEIVHFVGGGAATAGQPPDPCRLNVPAARRRPLNWPIRG